MCVKDEREIYTEDRLKKEKRRTIACFGVVAAKVDKKFSWSARSSSLTNIFVSCTARGHSHKGRSAGPEDSLYREARQTGRHMSECRMHSIQVSTEQLCALPRGSAQL